MPDTDQQQHTVVLGGGVAGLAAATYIARGGRAVTVVEKASTLGGRAATDQPNGFALNRGAHALYTGGAGSAVLRELGVSYSYGIPRRLFALDERGMHRLPASPLDLLLTTLLDGADKREVLGLFARLGAIHTATLGELPAAEWIDRTVRRRRVRALLRSIARVYTYSIALDLASADTVVTKLQQTARHPVHYVDGGWQTIVHGLRDAALQAGATLRTSTGADAIRLDNGRAVAVRLHEDLELPADNPNRPD
jgi:phytoene dehydrogenase-like protein